jgi:hypothetical protein
MERRRLAGFALILGLGALSGCVEPAPPQVAVAPIPLAAPPPVALVPVAVMPPPDGPAWAPAPRRHARIAHPVRVHHVVATRRWVRRHHPVAVYYSPWTPQCGSDVHPCNPQHTLAPVE